MICRRCHWTRPSAIQHRQPCCAANLWFDDRTANPLIAMLPPVLHFRAAYDGRPDGWLEPMLQFVAWENQAQAPGADAILARLGDVIVIQAIRAHLAS